MKIKDAQWCQTQQAANKNGLTSNTGSKFECTSTLVPVRSIRDNHPSLRTAKADTDEIKKRSKSEHHSHVVNHKNEDKGI